jgi:hypothetical protein
MLDSSMAVSLAFPHGKGPCTPSLVSVPAILSRVLDAHPEAVDDPDDYRRLVSNAVFKALSYDSALVDQLCTNKLKRAYYDQQQQLSLLQQIQINDKRPRFADGCAADSVTHATLVASATPRAIAAALFITVGCHSTSLTRPMRGVFF